MLLATFNFFIAISTIQLIYWLVLMIVQFRVKKSKSSEVPNSNPVSIIVCANNELENLQNLIPFLLNQNHNDFEVIIVNDRSDDGTYDFLNAEKEKYENLKIVNVDRIHNHITPKKYAITLGVKAAKNDLLLFTDADCKPSTENWAKEMSSTAESNLNFVLGYSPYMKLNGFLNALIRFETRLTGILYTSFAILGNPYMGVGRNLLYRKSLFIEKNGFQKYQNVTGGDDDLFVNQHAKGKETTVAFGLDSLMYSYPKTTWKSYFYQKKRHFSVGKFYTIKDRFLLSLFSITHISFWTIFIFLATSQIFPEVLIGILLLRLLIVSFAIGISSKKFEEPMNIWTIPAFDFIYSFYIIIAGTIAIFTKKVSWR